jgi:hypothetical protein
MTRIRLAGPFGEEARAGKQGGGLAVGLVERPVWVRHLAGMMGDVACDHRPFALGLDHDAHVARRVANGRREPDLRRDDVVEFHKLDEAGVEDGPYAIAEHSLLLLVLVGAPEFVFASADEVARVGEGRHPLAVLEHGVPADVVDVEVRAHYGVDRFARPAGLGEMLQEGRRQALAAGDLARPVVAHTGVDDQLEPRRLNQQRMNAELQGGVVLGDEVWIEPRRLAQLLGRGLRVVACRVRSLLASQIELAGYFPDLSIREMRLLLAAARHRAELLTDLETSEARNIFETIVKRVVMSESEAQIEIDGSKLLQALLGMLGAIFFKAQNKIQDPAKLSRLVQMIDEQSWVGMDADTKGDLYEGLLQKNAEDTRAAPVSTSRRVPSSKRWWSACALRLARPLPIRPAARAVSSWAHTTG